MRVSIPGLVPWLNPVVADSAAIGLHWIYDTARQAEVGDAEARLTEALSGYPYIKLDTQQMSLIVSRVDDLHTNYWSPTGASYLQLRFFRSAWSRSFTPTRTRTPCGRASADAGIFWNLFNIALNIFVYVFDLLRISGNVFGIVLVRVVIIDIMKTRIHKVTGRNDNELSVDTPMPSYQPVMKPLSAVYGVAICIMDIVLVKEALTVQREGARVIGRA